MKTLQAGMHAGVPINDYIRDPAPEPSISSGAAKNVLEGCPARAWFEHPRLNPAWGDDADSKTDVGKVAHELLLEGTDRVVVVDAADWRTKAAKEARDAARAEGKIPLLAERWPEVKAMVDAAKVALERVAGELGGFKFGDLLMEQTLIWQEPVVQPTTNGIPFKDWPSIWCRSRPDILVPDFRFAIDYKTTEGTAAAEPFAKHVINMGYDYQAALIRNGVHAIHGKTPDVVFMVQECHAPYLVNFVGLSPGFADVGERKLRAAAKRWHECLSTNKWPGYPDAVAWVEPPAWELARVEVLGML